MTRSDLLRWYNWEARVMIQLAIPGALGTITCERQASQRMKRQFISGAYQRPRRQRA